MNGNQRLLDFVMTGCVVTLLCMMTPLILRPSSLAAATDEIDDAHYESFQPPGSAGVLHYYASRTTDGNSVKPSPTDALVVIHGHPRDANKTFAAAMTAARRANHLDDTLIIAPVFQVARADELNCETKGVPKEQEGDLLWTCESWLEGGLASNDATFSSFDALDAILAEVKTRWPSLRTVTVAGFSAGAQMVQHYIGFAAAQPGVTQRFVVADPGIWLYFDPERPHPLQQGQPADWSACNPSDVSSCSFGFAPGPSDCAKIDQWKYGTEDMPTHLKRSAAEARLRYARANVQYLEGALDSGEAKGTYYRILDKSCAAEAQGPYRLQRGLAYAAYDRARLAPGQDRHVTIVPGCAHDVACVFPSDAARAALFDSR